MNPGDRVRIRSNGPHAGYPDPLGHLRGMTGTLLKLRPFVAEVRVDNASQPCLIPASELEPLTAGVYVRFEDLARPWDLSEPRQTPAWQREGGEFAGFCDACGGLRRHKLACPVARRAAQPSAEPTSGAGGGGGGWFCVVSP